MYTILNDMNINTTAVVSVVSFVTYFRGVVGIVVGEYENDELQWYIDFCSRERKPPMHPRTKLGKVTVVEFDLTNGETVLWDLTATPVAEA